MKPFFRKPENRSRNGWMRALLRPLALLLCLGVAGQDTAWAVVDLNRRTELQAAQFSIPAHLGVVKAAKTGSGSPFTIVNIKDIHDNWSAQESTAALLENLVANYDLRTVGLEGAWGRVDVSLLAAMPDADRRERTADFLIREGHLSAAERIAAMSPGAIQLQGMDDEALYERNLRALQNLLQNADAYARALAPLESRLAELDRAINSDDLRELERNGVGGGNGRKFSQRWDVIGGLAQKYGVSYDGYAAIRRMEACAALQKRVRTAEAGEERDRLIQTLGGRLGLKDVQELTFKAAAFKLGRMTSGAFTSYLIQSAAANGVDPVEWSELKKYGEFMTLFESLDADDLREEVAELESRIRQKAFENENQIKLHGLIRQTRVLKDLFGMRLSAADFAAFERERDDYSTDGFRRRLAELEKASAAGLDLDTVFSRIPEAEDFYEAAQARNEALLANLVKRMKADGRRSACLVTGGFHSRGMQDLMDRDGLSYVVILPRYEMASKRPYLDLLNNQTPSYNDFAGSAETRRIKVSAVAQYFALTALAQPSNPERVREAVEAEFRAYRENLRKLSPRQPRQVPDAGPALSVPAGFAVGSDRGPADAKAIAIRPTLGGGLSLDQVQAFKTSDGTAFVLVSADGTDYLFRSVDTNGRPAVQLVAQGAEAVLEFARIQGETGGRSVTPAEEAAQTVDGGSPESVYAGLQAAIARQDRQRTTDLLWHLLYLLTIGGGFDSALLDRLSNGSPDLKILVQRAYRALGFNVTDIKKARQILARNPRLRIVEATSPEDAADMRRDLTSQNLEEGIDGDFLIVPAEAGTSNPLWARPEPATVDSPRLPKVEIGTSLVKAKYDVNAPRVASAEQIAAANAVAEAFYEGGIIEAQFVFDGLAEVLENEDGSVVKFEQNDENSINVHETLNALLAKLNEKLVTQPFGEDEVIRINVTGRSKSPKSAPVKTVFRSREAERIRAEALCENPAFLDQMRAQLQLSKKHVIIIEDAGARHRFSRQTAATIVEGMDGKTAFLLLGQDEALRAEVREAIGRASGAKKDAEAAIEAAVSEVLAAKGKSLLASKVVEELHRMDRVEAARGLYDWVYGPAAIGIEGASKRIASIAAGTDFLSDEVGGRTLLLSSIQAAWLPYQQIMESDQEIENEQPLAEELDKTDPVRGIYRRLKIVRLQLKRLNLISEVSADPDLVRSERETIRTELQGLIANYRDRIEAHRVRSKDAIRRKIDMLAKAVEFRARHPKMPARGKGANKNDKKEAAAIRLELQKIFGWKKDEGDAIDRYLEMLHPKFHLPFFTQLGLNSDQTELLIDRVLNGKLLPAQLQTFTEELFDETLDGAVSEAAHQVDVFLDPRQAELPRPDAVRHAQKRVQRGIGRTTSYGALMRLADAADEERAALSPNFVAERTVELREQVETADSTPTETSFERLEEIQRDLELMDGTMGRIRLLFALHGMNGLFATGRDGMNWDAATPVFVDDYKILQWAIRTGSLKRKDVREIEMIMAAKKDDDVGEELMIDLATEISDIKKMAAEVVRLMNGDAATRDAWKSELRDPKNNLMARRRTIADEIKKRLDGVTPNTLEAKSRLEALYAEKFGSNKDPETGRLDEASVPEFVAFAIETIPWVAGWKLDRHDGQGEQLIGIKPDQELMLDLFFMQKSVGLAAGGGKSIVYPLYHVIARHVIGKTYRGMTIAENADGARSLTIRPLDRKGPLNYNDFAGIFGMDMVNGTELYEARQTGKLAAALTDSGVIVVMDRTVRAHITNEAESESELWDALHPTVTLVDEAHIFATERTAAVQSKDTREATEEDVSNPMQIVNRVWDKQAKDFLDIGIQVKELQYEREYVQAVNQYSNTTEGASARMIFKWGDHVYITEGLWKFLAEAGVSTRVIESTLRGLLKLKEQDKPGGWQIGHSRDPDGSQREVIAPISEEGIPAPDMVLSDIPYQATLALAAKNWDIEAARRLVRVSESSMQVAVTDALQTASRGRVMGASGTVQDLEDLIEAVFGTEVINVNSSKNQTNQYEFLGTMEEIKAQILSSVRGGGKDKKRRGVLGLYLDSDKREELKLFLRRNGISVKEMGAGNSSIEGMVDRAGLLDGAPGEDGMIFTEHYMAEQEMLVEKLRKDFADQTVLDAALQSTHPEKRYQAHLWNALKRLIVWNEESWTAVEGLRRSDFNDSELRALEEAGYFGWGTVLLTNQRGMTGRDYKDRNGIGLDLMYLDVGDVRSNELLFKQATSRNRRQIKDGGRYLLLDDDNLRKIDLSLNDLFADKTLRDEVELRLKKTADAIEATGIKSRSEEEKAFLVAYKWLKSGSLPSETPTDAREKKRHLIAKINLHQKFLTVKHVNEAARFMTQDTPWSRLVIDPIKQRLRDLKRRENLSDEDLEILSRPGVEKRLIDILQLNLEEALRRESDSVNLFLQDTSREKGDDYVRGVTLDALHQAEVSFRSISNAGPEAAAIMQTRQRMADVAEARNGIIRGEAGWEVEDELAADVPMTSYARAKQEASRGDRTGQYLRTIRYTYRVSRHIARKLMVSHLGGGSHTVREIRLAEAREDQQIVIGAYREADDTHSEQSAIRTESARIGIQEHTKGVTVTIDKDTEFSSANKAFPVGSHGYAVLIGDEVHVFSFDERQNRIVSIIRHPELTEDLRRLHEREGGKGGAFFRLEVNREQGGENMGCLSLQLTHLSASIKSGTTFAELMTFTGLREDTLSGMVNAVAGVPEPDPPADPDPDLHVVVPGTISQMSVQSGLTEDEFVARLLRQVRSFHAYTSAEVFEDFLRHVAPGENRKKIPGALNPFPTGFREALNNPDLFNRISGHALAKNEESFQESELNQIRTAYLRVKLSGDGPDSDFGSAMRFSEYRNDQKLYDKLRSHLVRGLDAKDHPVLLMEFDAMLLPLMRYFQKRFEEFRGQKDPINPEAADGLIDQWLAKSNYSQKTVFGVYVSRIQNSRDLEFRDLGKLLVDLFQDAEADENPKLMASALALVVRNGDPGLLVRTAVPLGISTETLVRMLLALSKETSMNAEQRRECVRWAMILAQSQGGRESADLMDSVNERLRPMILADAEAASENGLWFELNARIRDLEHFGEDADVVRLRLERDALWKLMSAGRRRVFSRILDASGDTPNLSTAQRIEAAMDLAKSFEFGVPRFVLEEGREISMRLIRAGLLLESNDRVDEKESRLLLTAARQAVPGRGFMNGALDELLTLQSGNSEADRTEYFLSHVLSEWAEREHHLQNTPEDDVRLALAARAVSEEVGGAVADMFRARKSGSSKDRQNEYQNASGRLSALVLNQNPLRRPGSHLYISTGLDISEGKVFFHTYHLPRLEVIRVKELEHLTKEEREKMESAKAFSGEFLRTDTGSEDRNNNVAQNNNDGTIYLFRNKWSRWVNDETKGALDGQRERFARALIEDLDAVEDGRQTRLIRVTRAGGLVFIDAAAARKEYPDVYKNLQQIAQKSRIPNYRESDPQSRARLLKSLRRAFEFELVEGEARRNNFRHDFNYSQERNPTPEEFSAYVNTWNDALKVHELHGHEVDRLLGHSMLWRSNYTGDELITITEITAHLISMALGRNPHGVILQTHTYTSRGTSGVGYQNIGVEVAFRLFAALSAADRNALCRASGVAAEVFLDKSKLEKLMLQNPDWTLRIANGFAAVKPAALQAAALKAYRDYVDAIEADAAKHAGKERAGKNGENTKLFGATLDAFALEMHEGKDGLDSKNTGKLLTKSLLRDPGYRQEVEKTAAELEAKFRDILREKQGEPGFNHAVRYLMARLRQFGDPDDPEVFRRFIKIMPNAHRIVKDGWTQSRVVKHFTGELQTLDGMLRAGPGTDRFASKESAAKGLPEDFEGMVDRVNRNKRTAAARIRPFAEASGIPESEYSQELDDNSCVYLSKSGFSKVDFYVEGKLQKRGSTLAYSFDSFRMLVVSTQDNPLTINDGEYEHVLNHEIQHFNIDITNEQIREGIVEILSLLNARGFGKEPQKGYHAVLQHLGSSTDYSYQRYITNLIEALRQSGNWNHEVLSYVQSTGDTSILNIHSLDSALAEVRLRGGSDAQVVLKRRNGGKDDAKPWSEVKAFARQNRKSYEQFLYSVTRRRNGTFEITETGGNIIPDRETSLDEDEDPPPADPAKKDADAKDGSDPPPGGDPAAAKPPKPDPLQTEVLFKMPFMVPGTEDDEDATEQDIAAFALKLGSDVRWDRSWRVGNARLLLLEPAKASELSIALGGAYPAGTEWAVVMDASLPDEQAVALVRFDPYALEGGFPDTGRLRIVSVLHAEQAHDTALPDEALEPSEALRALFSPVVEGGLENYRATREGQIETLLDQTWAVMNIRVAKWILNGLYTAEEINRKFENDAQMTMLALAEKYGWEPPEKIIFPAKNAKVGAETNPVAINLSAATGMTHGIHRGKIGPGSTPGPVKYDGPIGAVFQAADGSWKITVTDNTGSVFVGPMTDKDKQMSILVSGIVKSQADAISVRGLLSDGDQELDRQVKANGLTWLARGSLSNHRESRVTLDITSANVPDAELAERALQALHGLDDDMGQESRTTPIREGESFSVEPFLARGTGVKSVRRTSFWKPAGGGWEPVAQARRSSDTRMWTEHVTDGAHAWTEERTLRAIRTDDGVLRYIDQTALDVEVVFETSSGARLAGQAAVETAERGAEDWKAAMSLLMVLRENRTVSRPIAMPASLFYSDDRLDADFIRMLGIFRTALSGRTQVYGSEADLMRLQSDLAAAAGSGQLVAGMIDPVALQDDLAKPEQIRRHLETKGLGVDPIFVIAENDLEKLPSGTGSEHWVVLPQKPQAEVRVGGVEALAVAVAANWRDEILSLFSGGSGELYAREDLKTLLRRPTPWVRFLNLPQRLSELIGQLVQGARMTSASA